MKNRILSVFVMLLVGKLALAQIPPTPPPPEAPVETVTNDPKDSTAYIPQKRDSGTYIPRVKRSAWYFELGGNGLGASINLEKYRPAKDKNVWVTRIGVGYYMKMDTAYFLLPITFGKVYKRKRYLVEVAAGLAPYKLNPGKVDVYVTGVLAYRRAIRDKYFLKASFTPYIEFSRGKQSTLFNYVVHPYAGIGFGRYF